MPKVDKSLTEQFTQLLAEVESLAAEMRWDAIDLGRTARLLKDDAARREAKAAAQRAGLYADLLGDVVAKHRHIYPARPLNTPAPS